MSAPLVLALPSKGRLKDQTEAWLAGCGLSPAPGSDRGYRAEIPALAGLEAQFASAADIVGLLAAGEAHLGVTGEDLIAEAAGAGAPTTLALARLGFGRADLVVAAPRSWIDVTAMADLDEVAHLHHARTHGRLRVATKYPALTRAFFSRHGLSDYRIVESGGATEGAPAAGLAEAIVDITTTGATLGANGLRALSDGVILRSQAQLAASLTAPWSAERLEACQRLVLIVEAAERAGGAASLSWPAEQDAKAQQALGSFACLGAARAGGMLVARTDVFAAAEALRAAGVGPVSVIRPDYVFETAGAAFDRLAGAIGAGRR
ncbi:MAG TPA: ATP phosphoribosyltransferase [Caulobacteraceae bacterium]|nr:ATP phosphoribosyltransferase [Caulobacteraceae bacterium]